ncbi:hypothetical protein RRG08_006467 [Elysia crispata]|uniref:Uncharacterized protein n=1 Tax=Elysia crispata TaxID=231223 RepID=A0AAE0YAJ1_9GAST|nr:hypothetical protein RRG08_006467 [Elysia crispata]
MIKFSTEMKALHILHWQNETRGCVDEQKTECSGAYCGVYGGLKSVLLRAPSALIVFYSRATGAGCKSRSEVMDSKNLTACRNGLYVTQKENDGESGEFSVNEDLCVYLDD